MLDDGDSCILPNDIISEILTRLPANSIHRFKCVSKTWNSIICNPNFITSYISKSSLKWFIFNRLIRVNWESGPKFELQWAQPPNVSIHSININKFGDDSKEFLNHHKFPMPMITSSNGFMLISIKIKRYPFKETDSLYVVNPITHEWAPIPIPPNAVTRSSLGFVTEVGPTGVVERFMIVEYRPIIGSKIATLMCFSSETWKWEQISANYLLPEHIWMGIFVLEFDGHLMWVDLRVGIIAWDEPFVREKGEVHCRFIAVPRSAVSSGDRRCIGVGGGHIQFLEGRNQNLRLWRLKDYKGGEWSLVYKLCFKDVWSDDSYLGYGLKKLMPHPYFMHPYEADIVVLMVGNCSFFLNLGTKKVFSCGRGCSSSYKYTNPHPVPFKLPSWPTSFSPRLKASQATFWNEQGNTFYKAKDFNEAKNCYSRSIALSPSTLAFANRAMTHLNINKHYEAEGDCTEALKLDVMYVKAYWHRAIVRMELGNLNGSVEDVEFALKLEPDNQEAKKLCDEVKSLIEKANSSGPVPTAPPVQNNAFVNCHAVRWFRRRLCSWRFCRAHA